MNIINLSMDKITPYEKNPRQNDESVPYVAESIKEFGFKVPIIIDKNNTIVTGHTRYKAAKQLGLKEVPCIMADDLTDEQIKAFRLADNKVGERSLWDFDLLGDELSDILDIDMERFDFDLSLDDGEETEIIEDEVPDIPEEPKAKLGDIYQLGRHRLICGDSTSAADVEKLMDGALADMVVTDPPYNVAISNSQGMTIENDNMDNESFRSFLSECFQNLHDALKAGGVFYVWYASREHINFEGALSDAGLTTREQLIWNKNTFILGRQDYHWKHEPCLYGWKDGASHYFIDDRTQSTVFEDKGIDVNKMKKEEMKEMLIQMLSEKVSTTVINEDKPSVNDLHPTMKPIKLLARLIKNSSQKEENILDLFGGSGSTLIACEQLNRNCYMMELDPHYIDVIIQRWENLTGEKARLLNEI